MPSMDIIPCIDMRLAMQRLQLRLNIDVCSYKIQIAHNCTGLPFVGAIFFLFSQIRGFEHERTKKRSVSPRNVSNSRLRDLVGSKKVGNHPLAQHALNEAGKHVLGYISTRARHPHGLLDHHETAGQQP